MNLKRYFYIFIIIFLLILSGVFVYKILFKKRILLKNLRGKNVILITIDTLRADYLSIYSDKAETPNIKKFAEKGVVFERCIAQTPLTLPSHTTILSGTYPLFHKVRDNGGFVVPKKLELISEILKKYGYNTAAFIGAYVLHSKWGLNQGFDVYNDVFDMTKYKAISLGSIQKRADEVLKEARKWLIKNKNKKFFIWIHLYDPHIPYNPPPPFDEIYKGQPYRGEVEYTDYELGKFFNFLDKNEISDNSITVITGDHGESLGEHKESTHGFFIYQSTVWVPLIIKANVNFPLKRIDKIVEHVDIVPTILDFLGINYKGMIQGKSLLPLLLRESENSFNIAYTETYYPRFHYGWSELKGVVYKNYKYILAPKEEIYDLVRDPDELDNIVVKKSPERRKLKRIIKKFIKDKSIGSLSPVKKDKLTPEEMQKLSALGYVSGFVNTKEKELPDPKDKIEIYNSLKRIKKLMKKKSYDVAIKLAEKLLKKEPEIVDGYMLLGNLYYRKKDFEKAVIAFKEVLKRKPDYNFAMINIINCYLNMQEYEKAMFEIKNFIKKFPEDSALFFEFGKLYVLKGDYENAIKMLKRAIKVYPKNTQAMNKLGEIYVVEDKLDEAEKILQQAVKINPTMKEIYFNLAQIAEKKGNLKEANEYYLKEIKNNPNNFKAYYNIAVNYKELGMIDKAVEFYKKTMEVNPDFNIPYFMVAKYLFDKREDLKEAIKLCERGVKLKPFNKYTVFGYYLLSDIYSYLGYSTVSSLYYNKANMLLKKLNKN